MRTPLSTRALLAVLAVFGFVAARSSTLGSREQHLPPPTPVAATAAVPVDALDPVVAVEHQVAPEASRSDPEPAPGLIWPAPGLITSPFGGGRHHPGIDIDGITGDPVIAAGHGNVVVAGPAPTGYGGYGNLVVIDHGNGMSTAYAHLSRVDVTVGQVVEQGQQIAAIGNTGASTGDHLHFEVRLVNKPVDPMPYLPPRP